MDTTELELLQKRVTSLEATTMKSLKLLKDQNDVIKKLAEAIAVILKKLALDSQEAKGETND